MQRRLRRLGLVCLATLACLLPNQGALRAAQVIVHAHYLVLYYGGGIERYDANGALFDKPILEGGSRMTLGPDGNLYVSDYTVNVVRKYDAATAEPLGIFASTDLDGAQGLDFGPNGNLYVASSNNNRVVEFDGATGQFVGSIPVTTPIDLTFGPDQNLYVARGHHQISASGVDKFHGVTGQFLTTFATAPIFTPTALEFGPNGDLFVSNQISPTGQSVVRLSGSTGEFLQTIVSGISNPQSLAFRPDGTMLLAAAWDAGFGTVDVIDAASGAFLERMAFNSFYRAADVLYVPAVPEPASSLLVAVALAAGGLGGRWRR